MIKKRIVFILFILFALTTFAQTEGALKVALSTAETGGKYAPRNVMAIWIENSSGEFVKTLLAYGEKRKTHLNNWQEATKNAGSEYNVTDAITGATKSSHSSRSCLWDGNDYNGIPVNDGSYKLCFELTDKNETGNYTVIDVNKGNDVYTLTPSDEPSFKSIQIDWLPTQETGFNLISNNSHINVYPNPTNGLIEIHGKQIDKVEISDNKGNIIFSGKQNYFDLSNFAHGVYFIQITTFDGIVSKKIVKQ